jgi:thioredoxin
MWKDSRCTSPRGKWYACKKRSAAFLACTLSRRPTALPQARYKSHTSTYIPAMSDSIKNISDASFDSDVLNSDVPVLVDYWAEWCGPCKMIAPLLEDAAKLYEGRVIIAKLNVDENPDTAAKFGIRGIPTLMLFKDGKAAATKVGAMSKSQLTAFLDESL